MRRRSYCDAPRHAFANLALKYQFATCISAIYRDTFLRTARLWRSSRGGTDQIYRGRARAKCTPKFYPFASRKHLHALRICCATPHPRRKNEAVRARGAKTQRHEIQRRKNVTTWQAYRAVHETSRKAKRLLGLCSRKPSKIGFFKISPARRPQKSAF